MLNSLKAKIIIPSIAVILLLVSVLIAYTVINVGNLADELTEHRLVSAAQSARSYLDSLMERNRITSLSMSENQAVVNHVQNWNIGINPQENRAELLVYLNSIKEGLGVDAFVVIDANSNVILRTHEAMYGDNVSGIPIFDDAILRGIPTIQFSSTATLPMSYSAITPLVLDGNIIGSVSTIVYMHTDNFIDTFSRSLNAEITVFRGYERVATTILDENRQRAVGLSAPAIVIERVYRGGESLRDDIAIGGVPYSAYYFPLHGWDNTVIGMFFAGFSNEATVAATRSLLFTLLLFAGIGLVAAVAMMFFMIFKLLKPLTILTKTVKDVASGNVNVNINKNVSNDEIGLLTHDIAGLVKVVKAIVDDLSSVDHHYNVLGESTYRIDANKYENSFHVMATKVNTILDSETENIFNIIGALTNISDGNFGIKIHDLPGDWISQSESLRAVTAKLKELQESAIYLAENAVAGNFDVNVDSSKFKGSWEALILTLNNLMRAVAEPLEQIEHNVVAMSHGDFTYLDGEFKGIFNTVKDACNLTNETTRVYISEIADMLGRIAKGDLTTTVRRDYIGEYTPVKLALTNIVSSLSRAISGIRTASEQVLSGAMQISHSSTDLANGSQEQAVSVEELNNTIEVLDRQTQATARNAAEANALSDKSTTSAVSGHEAMRQMLDAMHEIKESSGNISKINKTIQDIAFQTNLLALNAAVEAARAGDQGRGFSVVAEEVRSLAARSQKSSTETTGYIDDSISRVEAGVSIAATTSDSLDEIVKNAKEMLDIINGISAASLEQAEAISQVNEGISQISRVVQSNSAVSEEAAAASQELASQAEILRELVAYFDL